MTVKLTPEELEQLRALCDPPLLGELTTVIGVDGQIYLAEVDGEEREWRGSFGGVISEYIIDGMNAVPRLLSHIAEMEAEAARTAAIDEALALSAGEARASAFREAAEIARARITFEDSEFGSGIDAACEDIAAAILERSGLASPEGEAL